VGQSPFDFFLWSRANLSRRININMSEVRFSGLWFARMFLRPLQYHDRHTMSRLIGAAPGYVGFEEGGSCFDAVDRSALHIIQYRSVD
jgi:hypothetical protein